MHLFCNQNDITSLFININQNLKIEIKVSKQNLNKR